MNAGGKKSKRRMTFNRLHGVAAQKIELFITTAVRTSDPASISRTHRSPNFVVNFI
jgi:hypothetical protein